MELVSLALFALALNMDAFGAGTAYGVRKIKLPFTSILIISCTSMIAIAISMYAGNLISAYLTETTAERLGGIMLIAIGIWILIQSFKGHKKKEEKEEINETIIKIHIRSLGLAIQVLKEPAKADLDKSGVISYQEALILGIALAMDAFAAGLAVSMLGFSILLTSLIVGVGHLLLTYAGILLGNGVASTTIGRQLSSALPGCLLIALGIFRI